MKLVVHYDKPELVLDILRRRHPTASIACSTDYASLPGILERDRPEILFTVRFAGTPNFPRAAMLGSPSLRWISVGGSGTDHLGVWDPARLTVTNAAGVAAEVMAEYVIGGLLHFTLGLDAFGRDQRRQEWKPGTVAPLKGRRLAILGLGKTGQAVARLAKAFGLAVTGIRAHPAATPNVDRVLPMTELHAVLAEADCVVVCLPLSAATRGLLDAAAFAALKPGAILVDISRGGVVQQAALVAALQTGRLRGAVLDVFETEPLPADNPLWAMPTVIVTPHSSSVYVGWEARAMEMFCDNLDRWQRGAALENVVDPARGY
jgi:phosphoglycerate dehydrogenase-like enzyme